ACSSALYTLSLHDALPICSAAVAEALRTWGLDAVNLSGGMCAWAAAGLPVVTPGPDITGLVVHSTRPLNCETSIPALIGGVVMRSEEHTSELQSRSDLVCR